MPFLVMTGRSRGRAGNQELVGLAIGRCHDDGTMAESLFAFSISDDGQTDRRYQRMDLAGQIEDSDYSLEQIWLDVVAFAGSHPVVVEQESTWRAFQSDPRRAASVEGHDELQFLGLAGLEHWLDGKRSASTTAGTSASTSPGAAPVEPADHFKAIAMAHVLYRATDNLAGRYVTWLGALHDLPHPTLALLLAALDPTSPRYAVVQEALMQNMAGAAPLRGDQKLIDGLVFRSAPQKLPPRSDPSLSAASGTCDETQTAGVGGKAPPAHSQASDLATRSTALLEAAFASAASDNPLERREGQTMMMRAVANGLESGGHVIVEAGTGTGKSLAYLLPAALYAREHDERVVVATHTTALQEQLRTKDLALLHAGAPNLVRTAILKGRNNYLCLRKLAARARSVSVLAPNEQSATLTLAVWVSDTETGDREEVALLPEEQPLWAEVQSDTDSCIHKRCSFFRDCYYFRAKAAAASADIVVTNHSLVLSDMGNDYGVLPAYEHLIIDEAHHLEDQATAQLGAEVTEYLLRRTLESLGGTRGLAADLRRTLARGIAQGQEPWQPFVPLLDQVTRHCAEVDRVFTQVATAVSRWIGTTGDAAARRIDPGIVQRVEYDSVTSSTLELVTVHKAVDTTSGQLQALRSEIEMADDSLFGRFEDVSGELRKLSGLLAVVGDVLLARSDPEAYVGWVA
ncbi:MAG: DEAD/DEAH box helicase, partial [Firmicutes bacterium]|nr:DEAD/DEAH box helicase [Bacillota bacterium]